jgi:hypothetical protein
MQDGPAVATWIFLVALFAAYGAFSALARRTLRAQSRALLSDHLLHWCYSQDSWRAYCERQRREIWFRHLRPLAGYLPPGGILTGALAWFAEQRAGLPAGFAAFATLVVVALAANTVLGPSVRSFIQLTRRRAFDYELYLGATGALEIWRQGRRICATEEHSFTAAGGRIERVEANGVDPAEIVFSLIRPLAFGFLHTEARFLVPEGQLAQARLLAHRLTPQAGERTAS